MKTDSICALWFSECSEGRSANVLFTGLNAYLKPCGFTAVC